MPISHKQPVQMWNGIAFSYVTEQEAKAMVKAGTHERTAGKDANKLQRANYFTRDLAAGKSPAPKKAKTGKPPRRAKGTYTTTQMKAG